MNFLTVLLIIVEIICCLLLTGLVLLQKSKSEGLGMAFGAGAGESLFGARAGNVLSKMTVILGIAFIVNTLLLGILFSQKDKTLMDEAALPVTEPASVQPVPVEPIDMVAPDTAPTTDETVSIDLSPAEDSTGEM